MSQDFPGYAELVSVIDDAVALADPHAITASLRVSLSRLIAEQRVRLPEAVYQADPSHYTRRLLHLSERHGYSVIAMTWAPAHTPSTHQSPAWSWISVPCPGAQVIAITL